MLLLDKLLTQLVYPLNLALALLLLALALLLLGRARRWSISLLAAALAERQPAFARCCGRRRKTAEKARRLADRR